MLKKYRLDNKHFLRAFDEYHKFIYRFIYFKVNRSKELAEDLTQDTFLRAWENRKKYDPKKSGVKTWLAVIARNLVIDNYRKNAARPVVNVDNTVEPESQALFTTDPTDANDANLELNEVKIQIGKLKKKEQEGLMLRYFEELEINEIAEIWGEKASTTRTFIFRALQKLKKTINHEKSN